MFVHVGVSDTAAVPLHRSCHQPQPAERGRRRHGADGRLFVPASAQRALLPDVRHRRLDRARPVAEPTRDDPGRGAACRPRSTTPVNCYHPQRCRALQAASSCAARSLSVSVCRAVYLFILLRTREQSNFSAPNKQ